jgi:hypothetical protein
MLRPDRNIASVYLHRAPIDMRRQIDGLSALVVGVMQHNPLICVGQEYVAAVAL